MSHSGQLVESKEKTGVGRGSNLQPVGEMPSDNLDFQWASEGRLGSLVGLSPSLGGCEAVSR